VFIWDLPRWGRVADYEIPWRWLMPSRPRAWRWIGVGVVTSRKLGIVGVGGLDLVEADGGQVG
jgi:hypothetical protein